MRRAVARLSGRDDVRDAYLRVTTRIGFEAFWPVSELTPEVQSGVFVIEAAPPPTTARNSGCATALAAELSKEALLASVTVHRDPLGGIPITPYQPEADPAVN